MTMGHIPVFHSGLLPVYFLCFMLIYPVIGQEIIANKTTLGEDAILICQFQPATADLYWTFGDKRINATDRITIKNATAKTDPDYKLSTLTIKNTNRSDHGNYTCVASYDGKETKAVKFLDLSFPTVFIPNNKTYTVVATRTDNGHSVTMECEFDVYDKPEYIEWWHMAHEEPYKRNVTSINDKRIKSSHTIELVSFKDNGTHECRIPNTNISGHVNLIVYGDPSVTLGTVLGISRDKIYLNWTVMPANSRIVRYDLWKNSDNKNWNGGGRVEANATSFVITGLEPNTTYTLRLNVRTEHGNNDKQPPPQANATTLIEDPVFVPNISINGFSATSVTIGWHPPPKEIEKFIHYYLLEARKKDKDEAPRKAYHSQDSRNLPYMFDNLNPHSTYIFKARACSDYTKECGKWSEEMEAATLDGIPGKPSNVQINCTSNLMFLSWAPPETPRAEIKGYTMELTGFAEYKDRSGHMKKDTWGPLSRFKSNDSVSVRFDDLSPNTQYTVKLSAMTRSRRRGEEYTTYCNTTAAPPDTPPRPRWRKVIYVIIISHNNPQYTVKLSEEYTTYCNTTAAPPDTPPRPRWRKVIYVIIISHNNTQYTVKLSEEYTTYCNTTAAPPDTPPRPRWRKVIYVIIISHNNTQYTVKLSEEYTTYCNTTAAPPDTPPRPSHNNPQYTVKLSEEYTTYCNTTAAPPDTPPRPRWRKVIYVIIISHNNPQYTVKLSEEYTTYCNTTAAPPDTPPRPRWRKVIYVIIISHNNTQYTVKLSEEYTTYCNTTAAPPDTPPRPSHNNTQYTVKLSEEYTTYCNTTAAPPDTPPRPRWRKVIYVISHNNTQYTVKLSEEYTTYCNTTAAPPDTPPRPRWRKVIYVIIISHNNTQYTVKLSEEYTTYCNTTAAPPDTPPRPRWRKNNPQYTVKLSKEYTTYCNTTAAPPDTPPRPRWRKVIYVISHNNHNNPQYTVKLSEEYTTYCNTTAAPPDTPPRPSHNNPQYTVKLSEEYTTYCNTTAAPPDTPPRPRWRKVIYVISHNSHNNPQYTVKLSEEYTTYCNTTAAPPDTPPRPRWRKVIYVISHNNTQYTVKLSEEYTTYCNTTAAPPDTPPRPRWRKILDKDRYLFKMFLPKVSERNGPICCYRVHVVRLLPHMDMRNLKGQSQLEIIDYEEAHGAQPVLGAYITDIFTNDNFPAENELIIGDEYSIFNRSEPALTRPGCERCLKRPHRITQQHYNRL
ncbi:fibronectin type III domain-containing protein [Phthorimaea operculella]|nr:fibronectin type III domain-containing protein [Phthorimaea operculella]